MMCTAGEAVVLGREVAAEVHATALRPQQRARREEPWEQALGAEQLLELAGVAGQACRAPERLLDVRRRLSFPERFGRQR